MKTLKSENIIPFDNRNGDLLALVRFDKTGGLKSYFNCETWIDRAKRLKREKFENMRRSFWTNN